MFAKELGLMLYVDDVAAEKALWQAAGFIIVSESQVMDFETFDMKNHEQATATITVYDKAFIRQVSPEVVDHIPSLLFESDAIEKLHERILGLTDTCSPLNQKPFLNSNFASPSGLYFAVKGV